MSRPQLRQTGRRTERVVPVTVLALAVALLGLALTIWRPLAPAVGPVATDLAAFDAAVLDAVRAYRTPGYAVAAVATLLSVAVPAAFVLLPAARRLVERVAGTRDHAATRAALVTLVVAAATSLAILPLAAWRQIVHDGRWGFRTQPAIGWFRDWLIASAGRWLGLSIGVLLLLWAIRRWPRSWPSRLTLVGTVLAGLLVLAHPLVIQPIFLPTGPFPDGPHRVAIEEVLARADLDDLPVRLGDASLRTTRVNAVITGLGPTARVVIYDTMLDLSPEQVATVMAHEVGHYEHADLPRGVLLAATGLFAGLWLLRGILDSPTVRRRVRGPADPRLAALIVALVAVTQLAVAPVTNHVSRRLEAAADARAFELSQQPGTFIRTARVFTLRDLSPPRPPRWVQLFYGTHPTPEERIAAAVAYAEEHGLALPDLATLRAEERDVRHPAIDGGLPVAPRSDS